MIKQQIITKSEELFMRYGIRSVSMDDIARELGVSKKTLYQQVENKSDLIRQIFAERSILERQAIEAMRKESDNAIEEMVEVARFMISRLRLVSPTSRYDLEKYYQDIHRELDHLHMTFFTHFIQENLVRGIEEGLYRRSTEVSLVAKFFVGMATRLAQNEHFSVKEYNLEDLISQLFVYHMHGVASENGMQVVREYLGHEDEEKI
ncbi:TetR/AcrR family transcriptional regulator [Lewinella cohaerens]|uniref:TetR/AcrR family transcriptional regulator n=1 Tax=Lewinella cohaerens TaxID=70995 RepID=UPI000A02D101|nr:TetR/AcrR family transcriptional regulator [Lewinella cohaerens]